MSPPEPLSCPFCDNSFDDEPAFRCHLMGRHHKSEMTDFILARLEDAGRVVAPA